MRIDVITLFPELVVSVVQHGVVSRAAEKGLVELKLWNPRDFTQDKHRTVDDRPYGGGPGMLMMVQPLRDAISAARQAAAANGSKAKVIYLSPQGRKLDQQGVHELAQHNSLIFNVLIYVQNILELFLLS